MLDLRDFFHLPQVETLAKRLVSTRSGLIAVAGLDTAPDAGAVATDGFLPSGKMTVLRILLRRILAERQAQTSKGQHLLSIVAQEKDFVRIPRQFWRQVKWVLVSSPDAYAERIQYAAMRRPQLLLVDRLDAQSASAALQAAQNGTLVLSQIDTVFSGAGVAHHLLDLGVPRQALNVLAWVFTVQRLAALCPHCKQAAPLDPARLAELSRRYPYLDLAGAFFQAHGCTQCGHSGREGSVAACDVFCAEGDPADLFEQASLLPLKAYILHLAALGHVSLADANAFGAHQLRRTYKLFTSSERTLAETNAALQRKLAQLEVANQVLEQRTEALVSLQGISQTLAALTHLDDLAARVCVYTRDLCGADRVVLYVLQTDERAEVLAVDGWDQSLLRQRLDAGLLLGPGGLASLPAEPMPFNVCPPGLPSHLLREQRALLKGGLRVPLLAQKKLVGMMFVHSTQKHSFAPGEVAMLQAFANQSAVALQRAALLDALRDKIVQLEKAHVELLEKEFIKETFGKLVDPRVRDYLLSGHIDLGGELKEASILFTDIRDFTPMSEKMRPDQVVHLLNRHFERMSECVVEQGGLVNRYIGDAMLAIFGVPLDLENHADAAVRAALDMRVARDALKQELRHEGLPPIHTGIGIHSGLVLAGNIGSRSRMEYTVIGDAVNLASRIEKLCKQLKYDLIVSEATTLQLSPEFRPVYLDTVRVPGKQQPIKVFYF